MPSEYCLSACWLVLKTTNICKMIWLRAQVACLTIFFAVLFPILLCSSTAAAILHALCSLSILSIFCVFFFFFVPLSALTSSSVGTSSCFIKLSCLEAASLDLQILSALFRSNSSPLSSCSCSFISDSYYDSVSNHPVSERAIFA